MREDCIRPRCGPTRLSWLMGGSPNYCRAGAPSKRRGASGSRASPLRLPTSSRLSAWTISASHWRPATAWLSWPCALRRPRPPAGGVRRRRARPSPIWFNLRRCIQRMGRPGRQRTDALRGHRGVRGGAGRPRPLRGGSLVRDHASRSSGNGRAFSTVPGRVRVQPGGRDAGAAVRDEVIRVESFAENSAQRREASSWSKGSLLAGELTIAVTVRIPASTPRRAPSRRSRCPASASRHHRADSGLSGPARDRPSRIAPCAQNPRGTVAKAGASSLMMY